uniref:Retroviral polymerase SH3-like domain-containing protein n=1 Tax=Arundo donax TaxID=35708 RepID=A0A0A9B4I7_ARUDO
MIFIGYDEHVKGYSAYDQAFGRVHITRDAVFDEEAS